jgi:hypothetical protein
VQGNYAMSGLLEVEISGAAPGNGTTGYDQIWVSGPATQNVTLDGNLALAWSGDGWSSANDRLWIIRNDTAGTLTGTFHGYADGATVGAFDGRSWQIRYGVDVDQLTGQLVAGNDVLLTPTAVIPEPSSLALGVAAVSMLWLARRRRLGTWRQKNI